MSYDLGSAAPEFPCLMYFNGWLGATGSKALEAGGIRFEDEGTMVCKECEREERPAWLIERGGAFRELRPTGRKRRAWARPLAWLWRFTYSEFEMLPPRAISVGELRDRIAPLRNHSHEAPIVSDLKRFLAKRNRDEIVTRELLTEWNI